MGKNTIYVGGAGEHNSKPLKVEGIALGAAILPGQMLEYNATGLDVNGVAATVFGRTPLFADKDELRTKLVTEAWTQNETMQAIQFRSGEFGNVLVASGNNITARGVALSSNGAGLLKIAVTDGTEEIIAYSDEIVNVTADALVRVKFA